MDEVKINKYLLSLFSDFSHLLSTPCCISPTLLLPDCSTFSLQHLINIITTGYTTGFAVTDGMSSEEINEIKDAANYLSVDLKDLQLGGKQTLNVNRYILLIHSLYHLWFIIVMLRAGEAIILHNSPLLQLSTRRVAAVLPGHPLLRRGGRGRVSAAPACMATGGSGSLLLELSTRLREIFTMPGKGP